MGVTAGATVACCAAPVRRNAEQRFVAERQTAFGISCVHAAAICWGLKTC